MPTQTPTLIAADRATLAGPLEPWGPRAGADAGTPTTAGTVVLPRGDAATEVGVWECTPGGWPIEDRPDTEVVVLLSGRVRLTNADGTAVELGPGDLAVLPAGWSGRWDVLETARKAYVTVA